jgi:hypothetical protein
MTKDVIELAREAGFGMQMALLDDPFAQSHAQRLYQQLDRFASLVIANERAVGDKWRRAIDHEMVIAHLGVANPDDEPAALLQKIIQWHVDVALDPGISRRARSLVDDGLERVAQHIASGPAPMCRYGNRVEIGDTARQAYAAAIRALNTEGEVHDRP